MLSLNFFYLYIVQLPHMVLGIDDILEIISISLTVVGGASVIATTIIHLINKERKNKYLHFKLEHIKAFIKANDTLNIFQKIKELISTACTNTLKIIF